MFLPECFPGGISFVNQTDERFRGGPPLAPGVVLKERVKNLARSRLLLGPGTVEDRNPIQKEFSILNYPNPFSDNTKIVYTLPEAGKVTLVITDMFGKTVRTLVDEVQTAGTYSIPVNADELNLTSGVYLYRIEAAGATDTYVKVNKMVFAR